MNDFAKNLLGPTADCPPLERLAGGADPAIERHLAACAYCRTELRLLREFEAAEARPDELASTAWVEARLRGDFRPVEPQAPRPSLADHLRARLSRAFGSFGHRALAGAAAALLVLVAGVYLLRSPGAEHRISVDETVWRSGGVAALAPAGDLSRAPSEFHWDAVPGAAVYRLRLMEVDRTVIWSAESAQNSVPIPDDLRAQLRPGRAFQWQVTAVTSAGQIIASSDLQSIHILATH